MLRDLWEIPRSSETIPLISVGGQSENTGFDLTIYIRGNPIFFSFRAKEQSRPSTIVDWPVALLLIASPIAMVIGEGRLWKCVGIFLILIFGSLLTQRSWKQWHWIEHQLALMLERGEYPTREKLEQQNPISLRCGSASATLYCLTFLSVAALFDYGLYGVPVACSCLAGYMTYHHPRAHSLLNRILWCVGFPAFVISLIFQRCLCMRRPSALQIDAVLPSAQRISHLITMIELQYLPIQ